MFSMDSCNASLATCEQIPIKRNHMDACTERRSHLLGLKGLPGVQVAAACLHLDQLTPSRRSNLIFAWLLTVHDKR
jgi:hypothetical protein